MREKPLTEFMGSKKVAKEHGEKPAESKGLKGPWELPEGWKWVSLGELIKLTNGKAIRKKELSEKPTDKFDIPVYGSNGIIGYTKTPLVKSKSIVIGRVGAYCGTINITKDQAWITDNAMYSTWINEEKVTFEFLYWLLIVSNLRKYAKGAAQPLISQKIVERVIVPLPPLEEQKRIVARLDEISRRLKEAKKLAREAREEAEKLMASALHEVFSKAEERGWEWVKLTDYAESLKGFAFSSKFFNENGEGIPLIRIRDLGKNETESYYSGPYDPAYIVDSGDILISMDGEFNVFVWNGPRGLLNQRVAKIWSKNPQKLDNQYLYYALKKPLKFIELHKAQTTVKHLLDRDIKRIKIPLPPLEEQKRIVAHLDSISERAQKLVKLYEEREKELEQLFPAILDRAFRGDV